MCLRAPEAIACSNSPRPVIACESPVDPDRSAPAACPRYRPVLVPLSSSRVERVQAPSMQPAGCRPVFGDHAQPCGLLSRDCAENKMGSDAFSGSGNDEHAAGPESFHVAPRRGHEKIVHAVAVDVTCPCGVEAERFPGNPSGDGLQNGSVTSGIEIDPSTRRPNTARRRSAGRHARPCSRRRRRQRRSRIRRRRFRPSA